MPRAARVARGPAVPARALTATRRALRARLKAIGTASYREVLGVPLTRPGRLLAGATPLWATVPLAVASAAGDWQPAVPVSVAMELTATALKLLDDLEDDDLADDDPLHALSQPRRLNASTGLLSLGLSTLDGAASADLTSAVAAAATGQDEDLAGTGAAVSEDDCLRIVQGKTAGLMSCAARLAATAAGLAPDLVEVYAGIGQHIGLIVQMSNDLRATDQTMLHSDLAQRKPTLLLTASGLTGPGAWPIAEPTCPVAVVDHLHASGAVAYVWLLAEAECQEALAELDTLAGLGHDVGPLRRIVHQVRIPPTMNGGRTCPATLPAATSAPPAYPAAASAAGASPVR